MKKLFELVSIRKYEGTISLGFVPFKPETEKTNRYANMTKQMTKALMVSLSGAERPSEITQKRIDEEMEKLPDLFESLSPPRDSMIFRNGPVDVNVDCTQKEFEALGSPQVGKIFSVDFQLSQELS